MLHIDGAFGEGGGQVLRSAVALSMVTGTPIRIENIRAGRRKPGLMRQHLTAVKAAAQICNGRVQGDHIGSQSLELEPGEVAAGNYHFAVGTAGSTTLVLQTVLPALLTASAASSLVLEGGTHNPMAPPFPFLAESFIPLINRMGPEVAVILERPGFYPAGGGRLRIEVAPCEQLRGLDLRERGKTVARKATALLARVPRHIGERELRLVQRKMGWMPSELHIEEIEDSQGPGNVLVLQVSSEQLTETFIGFGEIGVRAEAVAQRAVRQLRRYLKTTAPVGEYLADQLLLPLALAGSGSFTTLPLSRHAKTQIEILRKFVDVPIEVERADQQAVVTVGSG